ncbi:RES family NAD+ phosphorylase [Variovorax ureilyticus]|uniref:RES family NAD+ phosphorylase n=1 Tax=Variovorax ureilyticus TaxID=1836198 RepID=A0ABU8VRD4_9BURK
MNLNDLNPPLVELPPNLTWYRIQRTRALRGSVRLRGFVLPPKGVMAGRFDLSDEATAYLADSELTALYESEFRREATSCHIERLRKRSLTSFSATATLRLVDLRGLEEQFPVLQSLRYEATQAFAADCRSAGAHGVLYASAQHSYHACVCLFEAGIDRMKRIAQVDLVLPGTGRLHQSVVLAARGSAVPLIGMEKSE